MHRLVLFFFVGMLAVIGAACSSPGVLDDDESDTAEIIIDDTVTENDTAATDTTAAGDDSVAAVSVAEAQSLYVEGDAVPVVVCGYIVGTVKSSFATGGNDECMPVELRKGTAIRDSLNLVSNPGMLGAKVVIGGVLQRYFKVVGIKSASEFIVLD